MRVLKRTITQAPKPIHSSLRAENPNFGLEANCSPGRIAGAHDDKRHVRNSRKSEGARGSWRQINNAAPYKRTSVVYSHQSLAPVLIVTHFDHRAKWKTT